MAEKTASHHDISNLSTKSTDSTLGLGAASECDVTRKEGYNQAIPGVSEPKKKKKKRGERIILRLYSPSPAPGDPTKSSAIQSGVLPLVSLLFPSLVSDLPLG
jgi:hypothetical protein